jgi:urease accessory protein
MIAMRLLNRGVHFMKPVAARRLLPAGITAVLIVCSPVSVSAHPMPGVGDFYAGMLHPLTAIEFLLPMIALSLLAGLQSRTSAIAMLVTFPLSLGTGAVLGIPIHVSSLVSWINLSSMAVLGLLVAAARPLPSSMAAGLSTLLGITIGLANGVELGGQVSPWRFVPGLALAGLLLVTYGIGCVRRLNTPWMRIGFRVMGSWIAATGLMVLSLR